MFTLSKVGDKGCLALLIWACGEAQHHNRRAWRMRTSLKSGNRKRQLRAGTLCDHNDTTSVTHFLQLDPSPKVSQVYPNRPTYW